MIRDKEPCFVIPTYRLRDVGETVRLYDEHFWRNGHSVPIIVFDDSSPAAQEKYYPSLEQTRTHNDLYYVGAKEKDLFQGYVNERLRGATPPDLYDLQPRESLFHGIAAIRLLPVGGGDDRSRQRRAKSGLHGRAALRHLALARTFTLPRDLA